MFERIVGNNEVKETLTKSIQNETLSHSYLFVGIPGIGKKMLAKEFAKNILCTEKEKAYTCKSCIEFESDNHPDFIGIQPEGNNIKIEQIRFLQKKIQEKPIMKPIKKNMEMLFMKYLVIVFLIGTIAGMQNFHNFQVQRHHL